jgi:hypothetical protein
MTPKPCEVCGTPDKDARHARCRPCTLAWYTVQAETAWKDRWSL